MVKDNQLREDAEEAHADFEKKRIEIAESEKPTAKASWAKRLGWCRANFAPIFIDYRY